MPLANYFEAPDSVFTYRPDLQPDWGTPPSVSSPLSPTLSSSTRPLSPPGIRGAGRRMMDVLSTRSSYSSSTSTDSVPGSGHSTGSSSGGRVVPSTSEERFAESLRESNGTTSPSHSSGNSGMEVASQPSPEPAPSSLPQPVSAVLPFSARRRQQTFDPLALVQRKIQGLLNKLAPENFDSISAQVIELCNDSASEINGQTLNTITMLVFDKAVDQPNMSEQYALLCRTIKKDISNNIQDGKSVNARGVLFVGGRLFQKYLLTKCQEEFERYWSSASEVDNGDSSELFSDEYYAASRAKRRRLGLIKLVGELFKLQMLSDAIVLQCITQLLSNLDNPEEEHVENACKLLTTAGQSLDTRPTSKATMNMYFERMRILSKNETLSIRLRYTILDVIDLRSRKWQQRQALTSAPAPTTAPATHAARPHGSESLQWRTPAANPPARQPLKAAGETQGGRRAAPPLRGLALRSNAPGHANQIHSDEDRISLRPGSTPQVVCSQPPHGILSSSSDRNSLDIASPTLRSQVSGPASDEPGVLKTATKNERLTSLSTSDVPMTQHMSVDHAGKPMATPPASVQPPLPPPPHNRATASSARNSANVSPVRTLSGTSGSPVVGYHPEKSNAGESTGRTSSPFTADPLASGNRHLDVQSRPEVGYHITSPQTLKSQKDSRTPMGSSMGRTDDRTSTDIRLTGSMSTGPTSVDGQSALGLEVASSIPHAGSRHQPPLAHDSALTLPRDDGIISQESFSMSRADGVDDAPGKWMDDVGKTGGTESTLRALTSPRTPNSFIPADGKRVLGGPNKYWTLACDDAGEIPGVGVNPGSWSLGGSSSSSRSPAALRPRVDIRKLDQHAARVHPLSMSGEEYSDDDGENGGGGGHAPPMVHYN